MDPFVRYRLLGASWEDDIFAWISIGIDPAVDKKIIPAAMNTGEGSVAE